MDGSCGKNEIEQLAQDDALGKERSKTKTRETMGYGGWKMWKGCRESEIQNIRRTGVEENY